MVTVKAPTRIDIAGGTLDIWPLSVLFAPAACLNMGISLYATVKASKARVKGVEVAASHLPGMLCLPGEEEKKKTLFHRALDIFPVSGYRLEVETRAPPGSGLGGSSALLVALIKTLAAIRGEKVSARQVIELAKNIEARHLGIPTGIQDYVGALNGGVNSVNAAEGGMEVERLKTDTGELHERMALFYSGRSRISGKANWIMFKKALDGDKRTAGVFKDIAANSLEVKRALLNGKYGEVGPLLTAENRLREKLGPAVIPARLKKVFSALRRAGGHPKVCGAGGGGCFIVWCDRGEKGKISEKGAELGMTPLDYRPARPSVRK